VMAGAAAMAKMDWKFVVEIDVSECGASTSADSDRSGISLRIHGVRPRGVPKHGFANQIMEFVFGDCAPPTEPKTALVVRLCAPIREVIARFSDPL